MKNVKYDPRSRERQYILRSEVLMDFLGIDGDFVETLINRLQGYREKFPDSKIYAQSHQYYDDCESVLVREWYELENDQQYNARLRQQEAAKKRKQLRNVRGKEQRSIQEITEHNLYLKLKKKFEEKNKS